MMNSAPTTTLVAVILALCLAACGGTDDTDNGQGDATDSTSLCTPGESFSSDDGCNTCTCPDSGLEDEAACTTMACAPPACEGLECGAECSVPCPPDDADCVNLGATMVCNVDGECVPGNPNTAGCDAVDLCEGVVCPTQAASCDGDVAYHSSYSECMEGECVPVPGLPPENCAEQGMVCQDGECIADDLCADVVCEDVANSCDGTVLNPGWSRSCDPETGECLDSTAEQPFDCAADGKTCVDGQCIADSEDLCAGVDCTVPDTAFCDGTIAASTNGVGYCDSTNGTCYWDVMQQVDCADQDLECVDGACIDDTCEPNETYTFIDDEGCHNCKCPLSGLKSDATCSLTSDLSVCGEDLCASVTCKPTEGFCDGDTAHASSPTACSPSTGECEPTALALPKDCSAIGEICFQGGCVPADSDLCALAECVGEPAQCNGDFAVGATSVWCEPTTGECTALPGVFVENCAELGLSCDEGHCVYDPCAGLSCGDECELCSPDDITCEPTDAAMVCDAAGDCVPDDGSLPACGLIAVCTDEDCGPAPGMPNYTCEDGVTIAGPGDCELQDSGSCGWTIVTCPEDAETCTPGESFDADDGCNTCICPDTGLKSEANCTKMACSCAKAGDCTNGYFCDFPNDDCGVWGSTGLCVAAPEACVMGGAGACGCGPAATTNGCEQNAAGYDVFQYGGCSLDGADTFACGETACSTSGELCTISMNDIAGPMEPLFYNSCSSLPDDCEQGDCSCVSGDEWMSCYDGTGNTILFYPGG